MAVISKSKTDSAPDDTVLIQAAASGDRDCFTVLAKRYTGMMYAVAFRMTGSGPMAEDVVQESLVRLWTKAASWDKDKGASVKTWLYRITSNMAVDLIRKNKGGVYEVPECLADDKMTADKKIQQKEKAIIVRESVMALPDRQREALVLCYYEGLSNAEAANIMKTTVKAVEGLLVRARKAVYADLKKHREVL